MTFTMNSHTLLYPPTRIHSIQDNINVLHITDFHLCYEDTGKKSCYNCHSRFEKSLQQALSEPINYDLILVTGDLVSEIDTRIYDKIFERLRQTNIPFACVAGNHEVTAELGGDDIPFLERQLVAHQPDPRLLNQHVIETDYWQLLLLDSSHPGKISGLLDNDVLHWLRTQLSNNTKPALVALHHHVVPMQSAWIDAHILKNADELWQVLFDFEHVKVVTFGHVHQEFYDKINNISLYATPSTTYQFKPKQDKFAIDFEAKSGYRIFNLCSDGSHSSEVKRLTD